MSAPPSVSQSRLLVGPPLSESRSASVNSRTSNATASSTGSGIRLVPYSPPRLNDENDRRASSSTSSQRRPSSICQPHVKSTSQDAQPRRSQYSYHEPSASTSALSLGQDPLTPTKTTGVSPPVFIPGQTIKAVDVDPTITTTLTAPNYTVLSANSSSPSSLLQTPPRPPRAPFAAASSTSSSPAASPSSSKSVARRQNFVAVHSDKTFSIVPLADSSKRRLSSQRSLSVSTSSLERQTSNAISEEPQHSSPPTTISNRSTSGSLSFDACRPSTQSIAAESPWNFQLAGGLRKVPKSPDLNQAFVQSTLPFEPTEDLPSPTTPPSPSVAKYTGDLSRSDSTSSGTANYQVYGPPSTPDNKRHRKQDETTPRPSSSNPNYRILAATSSPAPSFEASSIDANNYEEEDEEENYTLHGAPSLASSPPIFSSNKHKEVRQQFSQESLTVAPLNTPKRTLSDKLSLYKPRSQESLCADSLRSFSTTFSDPETDLLAVVFPAPIYVQRSSSSLAQSSSSASAGTQSPLCVEDSSPTPMISHPHQWSSQLSTVASESEEVSSIGPSRSGSFVSRLQRQSSGFFSNHSRQLPSISSSLYGNERPYTPSRSISESVIETPQAAYHRSHRDAGPSVPLPINYQDEHGDGLADLHQLQHKSSRNRLPSSFSNSSDRVLRPSTSTSSLASSFLSNSVPTWARLYYSNGGSKLLAPSSESLYSAYQEGKNNHNTVAATTNTPMQTPRFGLFPGRIIPNRNQSRGKTLPHAPTPAHAHAQSGSRLTEIADMSDDGANSDIESVGGMPHAPIHQEFRFRAAIRKQTSSIWSPHLRQDRRASRYSLWEPPALSWSMESGLGRRNIQILCFIVGFIFPLTWMTASFLSLPPNPEREMLERGSSSERLEINHSLPHPDIQKIDQAQFESARWWRQLNRCMSVLGIVVIVVVVVLIVLGTRQR